MSSRAICATTFHRFASAARTSAFGDIVAVTGIEDVHIGYTINEIDKPDALPPISVDEPTLVMNFQVNTSPLAGKSKCHLYFVIDEPREVIRVITLWNGQRERGPNV